MLYTRQLNETVSLAHAVSVFGISGGKSAVQNIVLGGPFDQLVGFQRGRFTFRLGLGYVTASDSYGKIMLLRRQNLPVS